MKCIKCDVVKEQDQFPTRGNGQAGYRTECKKCTSIRILAYKARNLDKWRARDRKYASDKRATLTGMLQFREAMARRRALLKAATVGDVDYAVVLAKANGKCGICGGVFDESGVHFDHVIPLSKGGEHSERNLQATHPTCNIQKGAKMMTGTCNDHPLVGVESSDSKRLAPVLKIVGAG